MAVVVIAPSNVVNFPEGGGHAWVYLQYAHGLQQIGCEVYWLERFRSSGDATRDAALLLTFGERMRHFGLADRLLLYQDGGSEGAQFIGVAQAEANAILQRADLLLNFYYAISPALLARFRRTALVDIDPGLLQFWLAHGQLHVQPHDYYFSTGETVGKPGALFPDCGLPWRTIRPPVCLDLWPYRPTPQAEAFTTVSNWWGDEWITDGEMVYENNKRVTFMHFAALASQTPQPLELAIYTGPGDADDLRVLRQYGWRIRHSSEVTGSPEQYQAYLQASRGEFSCAKPSCMHFQNAWVSDRTLCYLASGKPVVVQNTGPSTVLPNGEGMFRFATLDEARAALETINGNYEQQCQAARALAERYFDARHTLAHMLNSAL